MFSSWPSSTHTHTHQHSQYTASSHLVAVAAAAAAAPAVATSAATGGSSDGGGASTTTTRHASLFHDCVPVFLNLSHLLAITILTQYLRPLTSMHGEQLCRGARILTMMIVIMTMGAGFGMASTSGVGGAAAAAAAATAAAGRGGRYTVIISDTVTELWHLEFDLVRKKDWPDATPVLLRAQPFIQHPQCAR